MSAWNPAPPGTPPSATAEPQPCPQSGNLDQKAGLVINGPTPPTP